MKLRVIVMNGQRIVEGEENGVWKIQEVSKAGKLKPGIYDLYQSIPADRTKRHDGIIVHTSSDHVYQQTKDHNIRHSRSSFYKTLPEIGTIKSIAYDAQGKVMI